MLFTSGECPKPGCDGATSRPWAASRSRKGAVGSRPSSPWSQRIGRPCPRSRISSVTPCTFSHPGRSFAIPRPRLYQECANVAPCESEAGPMRILTTHIGSLPRPDELVTILRQHDAGGAAAAVLEARARAAVDDVVRAQVAAGIDIVNDGEQGRTDYSTYIKDRLTGFEGEHADQVIGADLKEFPEFAARRRGSVFKRPPARALSRGETSAPSSGTSRPSR